MGKRRHMDPKGRQKVPNTGSGGQPGKKKPAPEGAGFRYAAVP
jgi:hypothetical protein